MASLISEDNDANGIARPEPMRISWLLGLILLLLSGCRQQQDAISLYVDAVSLREAGHNAAAVDKLNAAVESDTGFALAYSLLCEIYQEMNDYTRSAAACSNAVAINPWSFEDQFNLGWSFLMINRPELASRAFSKACELNPGHLAANINAAMSYYEIRDYQRALFYGKRIQQIDPNTEGIEEFISDVQRAAGQSSSLRAGSGRPSR